MTKKLTLDEVAERAGVSRTTASRVMNERPHVRPEVRARVLRIIEETGYQPHPVARSLASQRTHVLGIVIPRQNSAFFTDPYFPCLLEGIAQECNAQDYTLALFLLQTPVDEEKVLPRITRRGALDGLIVQVGQQEDHFIKRLLEGDVPLVVAGRPAQATEASYVDVDNRAGAYTAVMHLFNLGHTCVATITGPRNTTAGMDRYAGYIDAHRAHKLPINETLVTEGDFSESGGYRAMHTLLEQHPDAVFAASDMMAIGAMRAIHETGLRVPDDIAVVGFDDLPPAAHARPPLTTVHQPVQQFGRCVVKILLDIVENDVPEPCHNVLSTNLVIRDSCGMTQE